MQKLTNLKDKVKVFSTLEKDLEDLSGLYDLLKEEEDKSLEAEWIRI